MIPLPSPSCPSGQGVISVASNLFPREVAQLVAHSLNNDFAKATKLHRKFYPIFRGIFIEPNPVPMKVALEQAGILSTSVVRSPLCEMSNATRAQFEKILQDYL